MSLAGVTAAFTARLDEARAVVASLASEEASFPPGAPPMYSPEYRRLAGCCLVLLYAALEYGIAQATRETLQSLDAAGVKGCDFIVPLYSVVLNSEFDSCATVKNRKKWPARLGLLAQIEITTSLPLNDSVFDLDLQMTSIRVMEQIFNAFGIRDPVVPDTRLRGYIDEIKDKRNIVAHGRDTVSSVGAGYNSGELRTRCDAVNRVVNHYIAVLDNWLTTKSFVKRSARHLYP